MEQELQELKAVLAAMSEQLRMMNDLILTKDAQISAIAASMEYPMARVDSIKVGAYGGNSTYLIEFPRPSCNVPSGGCPVLKT